MAINNYFRFGLSSLLFIYIFLFSINAVVLVPGTDADINYTDSNTIMWSSIKIYAKTGISTGDIIEIPYNASDSSMFGLYPMYLKFKDQDITVCMNEVLSGTPGNSYPICFYNNNMNFYNGGFNYSVKEAQGIFTTKEYDIVWGVFSNIESFYKTNVNVSNIYTFTSGNYFAGTTPSLNYNLYSYFMNVSGSESKSSSSTVVCGNSQGGTKSQNINAYNPGVTYNVSYIGRCQPSADGGASGARARVQVPSGVSVCDNTGWTTSNPSGVIADVTGSFTGNIYCYSQDNYYDNANAYLSLTSIIPYNKFIININKSSNLFSNLFKGSGTSGDLGSYNYSYTSEDANYIYYDIYKKQSTINLDSLNFMNTIYSNRTIVKEPDDILNGITLIPYQTNSAYPNYITIKKLDTTTLFFDLYDLDAQVTTLDMDSYFQDGNNTIVLDQVNNDGGYWIIFQKQYNMKPVVQGTLTINTTSFKKGSSASGSGGTYYDADSDTMSQMQDGWFKNGVLELNGSTISLNSTTFAETNNISYGKRFNDGKEWGDWVYSSTYVVQDTNPTISINISPSSPQPTDNLTCSFSGYYDIDSDVLVSQNLTWSENGTLLNSTTGTSIFLSNSVMQNNKIYKCNVQLNQADKSINISELATLTNIAPTLDSITTPTNTYSNYATIENFATASDINNGQTMYWTFEYSSDLSAWNNIAVNQSNNTLNWNVSSLSDGTYYLRAKVNDGYLETNYSSIVNINIVNFNINHTKENPKAFLGTTLTLESTSPSNMVQYSTGTTGIYCGDFNGANADCYFYTPIKFDSSKSLYYIDITPYQYYESGTVYQTGYTQNIYDVLVYEVSNIGDIPTTSPTLRKTKITFEMDKANRINLNVIPNNNKYVAVKVCVNSDLSGLCGTIDNGGDDLIFLYGKTSGTYIMKTKQGSNTAITNYDSNIEFYWEDILSNNIKVEVNDLYGDVLLEPMVIQDSTGTEICVDPRLSSYFSGISSSCITKKGSSFELTLGNLSKASKNEYTILWGKEIDITGTTYNDAVIKSYTPTNDVKMHIYGLANSGFSYPSNVYLKVNNNDLWNYPSTLNSRESTNSIKTNFNQLLNNMIWTTTTPGKILYYFEPYYINFSVEAPDNLKPIDNGIAPLRLNITTNLVINPTLSYCKIEGNNINVQTSTFVQTSVGIYKCEPSLEYSDLAGSYKWTVHIQDTNNQYKETDGFFTYGNLESATVTNIDFGKSNFDNSSTEDLVSNLLIENTGNTLFSKFKIDAIEDKFWDKDGVEYFAYKNKLGHAPTKTQLDSVKYYEKFDVVNTNEIYNGSLAPKKNVETWWKLSIDRTIKKGDYTTKWDLIQEVAK